MNKLQYFSRIISAYILRKPSQISFWHGEPEVNDQAIGSGYWVLGTGSKTGKGKGKEISTEDEVENTSNKKQVTGDKPEQGTRNPQLETALKEGWQYWQKFEYKANYSGPIDKDGVIILDYHGNVGKQKYHIAIAQFGLACYNRWKKTGDSVWYELFMAQVKWHVDNLRENKKGIWLWYADFDWDYHGRQKAPWASALAQGNGLSLLCRAYAETKDDKYLNLCEKVYQSMITEIEEGGVLKKGTRYGVRGTGLEKREGEKKVTKYGVRGTERPGTRYGVRGTSYRKEINKREIEELGSSSEHSIPKNPEPAPSSQNPVPVDGVDYWLEEMLNPAKHIINGFMWAVMGVFDYWLLTEREDIKEWFDRFTDTIARNLHLFDTGFWSLYELSGTKIPMIASHFYHKLHIVQLKILYNMTGDEIFLYYANKWTAYRANTLYRFTATIIKGLFKVVYW